MYIINFYVFYFLSFGLCFSINFLLVYVLCCGGFFFLPLISSVVCFVYSPFFFFLSSFLPKTYRFKKN